MGRHMVVGNFDVLAKELQRLAEEAFGSLVCDRIHPVAVFLPALLKVWHLWMATGDRALSEDFSPPARSTEQASEMKVKVEQPDELSSLCESDPDLVDALYDLRVVFLSADFSAGGSLSKVAFVVLTVAGGIVTDSSCDETASREPTMIFDKIDQVLRHEPCTTGPNMLFCPSDGLISLIGSRMGSLTDLVSGCTTLPAFLSAVGQNPVDFSDQLLNSAADEVASFMSEIFQNLVTHTQSGKLTLTRGLTEKCIFPVGHYLAETAGNRNKASIRVEDWPLASSSDMPEDRTQAARILSTVQLKGSND